MQRNYSQCMLRAAWCLHGLLFSVTISPPTRRRTHMRNSGIEPRNDSFSFVSRPFSLPLQSIPEQNQEDMPMLIKKIFTAAIAVTSLALVAPHVQAASVSLL